MWIRPTEETTKKDAPRCLPQGGVETATMKQILFGKFEKLWKIFRIFEKFFSNIPQKTGKYFRIFRKLAKKFVFHSKVLRK